MGAHAESGGWESCIQGPREVGSLSFLPSEADADGAFGEVLSEGPLSIFMSTHFPSGPVIVERSSIYLFIIPPHSQDLYYAQVVGVQKLTGLRTCLSGALHTNWRDKQSRREGPGGGGVEIWPQDVARVTFEFPPGCKIYQ